MGTLNYKIGCLDFNVIDGAYFIDNYNCCKQTINGDYVKMNCSKDFDFNCNCNYVINKNNTFESFLSVEKDCVIIENYECYGITIQKENENQDFFCCCNNCIVHMEAIDVPIYDIDNVGDINLKIENSNTNNGLSLRVFNNNNVGNVKVIIENSNTNDIIIYIRDNNNVGNVNIKLNNNNYQNLYIDFSNNNKIGIVTISGIDENTKKNLKNEYPNITFIFY